MGKNFARKAICMILAMSLVLSAAAVAFAASSPVKPKSNVVEKHYTTYTVNDKSQTATLIKAKANKKVYTFDGTIMHSGKTYTMVKIAGKAFAKVKKLKTIKITCKKSFTVDKNAFQGLSKAQLKKVVVKVTKKMSKKEFKKLKKQFQKAGIKSKNIKRVKM